MSIKDGGPAYPVPDLHMPDGQIQFGSYGMSLRDHFAGLAMQGILSAPIEIQKAWIELSQENGVAQQDAISGAAYEYADAMLRSREAGQ